MPLEAIVKLIHTAWDALVFITHQSNAVTNIPSDKVKGVFSASITNGSQLGSNSVAAIKRSNG